MPIRPLRWTGPVPPSSSNGLDTVILPNTSSPSAYGFGEQVWPSYAEPEPPAFGYNGWNPGPGPTYAPPNPNAGQWPTPPPSQVNPGQSYLRLLDFDSSRPSLVPLRQLLRRRRY